MNPPGGDRPANRTVPPPDAQVPEHFDTSVLHYFITSIIQYFNNSVPNRKGES